jgi:hypothetical protein
MAHRPTPISHTEPVQETDQAIVARLIRDIPQRPCICDETRLTTREEMLLTLTTIH